MRSCAAGRGTISRLPRPEALDVKRSLLLRQISKHLHRDQLVWFGTRGDDVEGLADLPELSASLSIISPQLKRSAIEALALEQLSGVRVDLDDYDIDADEAQCEALDGLRVALWRTLHRPSALVTYRPSMFVASAAFVRRDRCRCLGLFRDHQGAFEHKPWVETAVADLGVRNVPWGVYCGRRGPDSVAEVSRERAADGASEPHERWNRFGANR